MISTEISEAPVESKPPPSEYVEQFCKHQQNVQAHLRGRPSDWVPLHPTYFPPASYWSSEEKDLFFHGLTVYSRFRPDLIAEHIASKNIFDVCLYLDSLSIAASQEHEYATAADTATMMEPAMEVSEQWIEHEERMVKKLNTVGECLCAIESEGNEKRSSTWLQSSCSCLHDKIFNTTPPNNTESLVARSDGGEYFAHLDLGSLMAMESIIRESDLDPETLNVSYNENDEPTKGTDANDDGMTRDVQKDLLTIHNCIESEYPESPAVPDRSQLMSETTVAKSVDGDSGEYLTEKERDEIRRLRKRLFMRRKRAEQAGKVVIAEVAKLRPGRQKRERKPPKPRPKTYKTKNTAIPQLNANLSPESATFEQPPEQSSLQERNDDIGYELHTQSGLTKSYRVKKFLLENGIDSATLSSTDLDFFHLPTIARLMRLFNSFNGSTRSSETESISADTVQLLASMIQEFVSEIIRRTIITKEQEIRLKRELKIWKYDRDEITAENLIECLKSMGLDHLRRENYFSSVVGRIDRDSNPNDFADYHSVHSQLSQDSGIPEGKDQLFRTPQLTLPGSMLWCYLPSHRHLFTSDEPIPVEVDQDELEMQLAEDENVNMEDQAKSKEYEASLWKMRS